MKPNAAALSATSDPHQNDEPRCWASSADARPIDLVHLTRQTFGDKRLETELLRLFMRQSDQIEKSLEVTGTGEEHAMSCVELLHMLSGSARAIGATEIATIAGGLEARMRLDAAAIPQVAELRVLSVLIAKTNHYIADLLDQG